MAPDHGPLIDAQRIALLGGLNHPDIRRILDDFVSELSRCQRELTPWLEQRQRQPLIERLHQLRGAALSTGFTGIAAVASRWHDAADPFDPGFAEEFRKTLKASALAWRKMTA